MKKLNNKKNVTNEDYVRYINSNISQDYEMFTEETTKLVSLEVAGRKIPRIAKEVPITRNVIRHKSCGNIFWIEHNTLMSQIKKGLELCPHCKKKRKKEA